MLVSWAPHSLDRRNLPTGSKLPLTAIEGGFWECNVDQTWVPYVWPITSVLEMAFCSRMQSVEFSQRNMKYRVDFRSPVDSEVHGAVQVNIGTGAQREVRRWPNRSCSELAAKRRQEQQKAAARAAWQSWLQADFAWTLFDVDENVSDAKPSREKPRRKDYHLRVDGLSSLISWPQLLRTWPSACLEAADHPFDKRCSFALKRLIKNEEKSQPTLEWKMLEELWDQGGMKDTATLVGAYRIQNRGLIHTFAATQQAMLARLGGEDFVDGASRESQINIRMLWHGTSKVANLLDICSDGFDRARAQTCVYGKGCYFALRTSYSDKYSCFVKIPCEDPSKKFRAMVLAAVLVGETAKGNNNMYPPPVKPHSESGERYESTCDNVSSPCIFVTYKDGQALPAYVVIYEPRS